MTFQNSFLTIVMLSAGGLAAYEYLKPPAKLEDHSHKEGSHAQANDDQVPPQMIGPKSLVQYEDTSAPGGPPTDSMFKKIRQSVLNKQYRNAADTLNRLVDPGVRKEARADVRAIKEDLNLWDDVKNSLNWMFPAEKPALDVKGSA